MNLPSALVSQVKEGKVVVLLGSGASLDSTAEHGGPPPSSEQLAALLASKFLSPSHSKHDLMTVAELAISETSLPTVQDYIASLLSDLKPSPGHRLLPTFRWRGLATTNYDRLIEVAYEHDRGRAQNLSPVISDADNMDDALRGRDRLVLLKLHGCVSRTRDERVPFILTPDQYITHRRHRNNLFRTLKEWGADSTLVAIGHSLRDPDLRQILLELEELGDSRPRHYVVGPDFTDEEERLWGSRRITAIRGTFSEFLTELDSQIPSPLRRVPTPHDEHPLERLLGHTLSEDTREYLGSGADFVHSAMNVGGVQPSDFYRGMSPDWAAIEQGLDVRRRLVDTLLYDVVLTDESDRQSRVEFFVIRAEAGAGKTICLQRVAWEAATDAERLCLFVGRLGYLDFDAVAEIAESSSDRLFVFVDNAAENVAPLDQFLRRARRDDLPITVVSAERQNEWNIYCERLEEHLTAHYRLHYLNEEEIRVLIRLLETHRSLGYLAELDEEQRMQQFTQRAGRQLLVALLEATRGQSFEEILVDEYDRIVPESARSLYLSVCVLNRLDIPVRAGLISRVHGIPFSEFRDQLFAPLEHVVRVREDKKIGDYVYLARHPLIAQVVFDRILTSRDRRFDEYLRLVTSLNLSYSTDMAAFRRMIRGRVILDLFPDHDDATAIFNAALDIAPSDVHVLHQRGIYEMRRPNGNLAGAHDLLREAARLSPQDLTIVHSLAELERRRGELAINEVQRRRHRDEAVRLARTLRTDAVQGPYGYHTILKTKMDDLREVLGRSDDGAADIDRTIQDIEETLAASRQRFPEDEYILAAEAEFAGILRDDERARLALERAFQRNNRSPYIASRLARVLQESGQVEDAVGVLEAAVEANSGNQQLNYAYAQMLRQAGRDTPDTMIHHLRRAFVPGDRNYEAQFWYACYLYMKDTPDTVIEARNIFRTLWSGSMPYRTKSRVRAHFTAADGTRVSFAGFVRRREDRHGWIQRDGAGDSVMVRSDDIDAGAWEALKERQRVRFEIGFSFGGPVAVSVSPVGGY